MQQKYGKDGLVVMTVSIDPASKPLTPELKGAVVAMLRKHDVALTNLILDEPLEVHSERLRFTVAPCIYVFDRAGKWTQFIELKKDENYRYYEIEGLVKKLLAQK